MSLGTDSAGELRHKVLPFSTVQWERDPVSCGRADTAQYYLTHFTVTLTHGWGTENTKEKGIGSDVYPCCLPCTVSSQHSSVLTSAHAGSTPGWVFP